MTFSRDGSLALVVCSDSGELLVIDAQPRTLRCAIALHGDRSEQGYRPLDVACDPEAAFAYVSCSVGEMILVIDLATHAVVDRFDTGRSPYGVCYARRR
ncbi:MAG: YncE family protein [Planctomycetota bacterium]